MRLARMIGGDRRELIPEWFEIARVANRCLPAHFVPLVLEHVPPKMRADAVLGPVAAWLAQLNPAWVAAAIVTEPSEQRWQEGTLEERRIELAAMRERDPARGRDWLTATWASDPPEAREAFVQALQTGLSDEDEAFLEAALDDKRKGVRRAAVECLVRLPRSAHAQRMRSRLEPLLALESRSGILGKLAGRKLTIELPGAPDRTAQRDGVELKAPAQRKLGERTYWLVQMVTLSQPGDWTLRFQCDPAMLIEAVLATDHAIELLGALSEASMRYGDPAWLHPLCEAWLSSNHESHIAAQAVARLVASARDSERSTLLEDQLAKLIKKDVNAAFSLLENMEVSWTSSLTMAAIQALANHVRDERQQWSHNRNALARWALRCDVQTAMGLLPRVLDATPAESAWRNALQELNDTVEFRAAMKREML